MDKKVSKDKEIIVKNRPASGKNFTEAWVSHIPDDPSEHAVDELSAEHLKKLIEEDDATYIEPGDSASQVGCLARQVNLLLKSIRQDGSPGSSPGKNIPRRFRALLEQLGNAGASQLSKKPPKIPRTKKNDAESGSKVSLPKEPHFAVPAVPSLSSNVSKKKNVISLTAGSIAPLPSPEPPIPEPEKASETEKIASNVEKSLTRKAPKNRKIKGLLLPISNAVKAIQRYVGPTMKYDRNFVNAVAAAGIVYTKRTMDQSEKVARQRGHDSVHTSDMLEVFKMEHGTKLTESYFKRMEELFPNL